MVFYDNFDGEIAGTEPDNWINSAANNAKISNVTSVSSPNSMAVGFITILNGHTRWEGDCTIVSFKIKIPTKTSWSDVMIYTMGATGSFVYTNSTVTLRFDYYNNKIWYVSGPSTWVELCSFTKDVFHTIKIIHNSVAHTFNFYYDSILIASNCPFRYNFPSIECLIFYDHNFSTTFGYYIDDVIINSLPTINEVIVSAAVNEKDADDIITVNEV